MGCIDTIIAWVTMLGIFLLSIIYPLRKYCTSRKLPVSHLLCRINRFLRKIHKPLGVLIIPITFLHCRFSTQKLGLNFGTLCLVLLVILLFTYLLRKVLKGRWMKLHRAFTTALWIIVTIHIVFDTERISELIMKYFSLTNIFWYYAAYGVITFLVMQLMPKDKRKKILTYTIEGTFFEKALAMVCLISRYAMMALSLILPFYSTIQYVVIGNILYMFGLFLSTLAMWQFSKENTNQPITRGLYHVSRNPMQVMGFIMCIGIAFIANNIWLWGLTAINIVTSYPMFLMQERYCIKKYGNQYVSYMKKTPRILLFNSKSARS